MLNFYKFLQILDFLSEILVRWFGKFWTFANFREKVELENFEIFFQNSELLQVKKNTKELIRCIHHIKQIYT